MKINTDGVLLAATTANIPAVHILDIGTGTGVIALMLAQRFEKATLEAVEIDALAADRAKQNFLNSPFSERMSARHTSFEGLNPVRKYDLIISNPPFYTDSLHNPDNRKKTARHADLPFFERLFDFAGGHLMENGLLRLILPPELAEQLQDIATAQNLITEHVIAVQSYNDSPVFRKMITWRKGGKKAVTAEELLIIYERKGVYSERYKELLRPYFLAF
ncbi:tRNA1(Val) (adenine(37)-N6)-methyltransferase [Sphingobacterium spiritivorum]|nr:methyltransferase [Sphingobacterium sp. UBA5789]